MARTAAALSVLVVLLLGAVVAVDDPGMLLTLVGAALCALGCVARAPRVPRTRARPWSSPAAAPAAPPTAPPASTTPTPPAGRVRGLPGGRSRRSDLRLAPRRP